MVVFDYHGHRRVRHLGPELAHVVVLAERQAPAVCQGGADVALSDIVQRVDGVDNHIAHIDRFTNDLLVDLALGWNIDDDIAADLCRATKPASLDDHSFSLITLFERSPRG